MSQQPLEGLGHRPAGQAPDFQAPTGWPGGPGYTAPSQGRAPYGTSPQPGQPPYGSAGISYAHRAADLQGSAPASPYPAPPYPTAPPPKPDLRWWALGIIGLFVMIGIVTVVVLQQPKRPVAPAAPTPATVTPDRTTTAPRTTAPQTTPTRSTSTATRGPSTATQATAPATRGFTITPPPGWGYATTSGTSNDVRLVDSQGSTLTVYSWASQETGAARCAKELPSQDLGAGPDHPRGRHDPGRGAVPGRPATGREAAVRLALRPEERSGLQPVEPVLDRAGRGRRLRVRPGRRQLGLDLMARPAPPLR